MRILSFEEQLDRARIFLEEITEEEERRFPGLRAYAAQKVKTLEACVMLQNEKKPVPELNLDAEKQIDVMDYLQDLRDRREDE